MVRAVPCLQRAAQPGEGCRQGLCRPAEMALYKRMKKWGKIENAGGGRHGTHPHPEQMRKLEQAYMERTGTPSIQLMERAAPAVARWAMELAGGRGARRCSPAGAVATGATARRRPAVRPGGGRALVLPVYGEERLAPTPRSTAGWLRTAPGVVFIAAEDLPRWACLGWGGRGVRHRPVPALDQRQDLFARMGRTGCWAPVLAVDIPLGAQRPHSGPPSPARCGPAIP